jgi:hypothetical protein
MEVYYMSNNTIVNESLKNGLIEYVNSVLSLYYNYMSNRSFNGENDILLEEAQDIFGNIIEID